MQSSRSNRLKLNAELAARGANRRIKKVIREHTPAEEQKNLQIEFYCECSNPTCKERLSLTLEEFERLHDEQSRFVIAKNHGSPTVEKVIKTKRHLQVVEKYAL